MNRKGRVKLEKENYADEIESVHSEIGDNLDHFVLRNELNLNNKFFPIRSKNNCAVKVIQIM